MVDIHQFISLVSSPEILGGITSFAALVAYITRLTFRIGARFRENELRILQMQEQLDIQEKELEVLIKNKQEHYCLSHEEARKFLHYHHGNEGTVLHT